MAEEKILGYDYSMPYADGTDNVTTALRELLNILCARHRFWKSNVPNIKCGYIKRN